VRLGESRLSRAAMVINRVRRKVDEMTMTVRALPAYWSPSMQVCILNNGLSGSVSCNPDVFDRDLHKCRSLLGPTSVIGTRIIYPGFRPV
jgi:hypothetical protein